MAAIRPAATSVSADDVLAGAERLLVCDPAKALAQAEAVLKQVRGLPRAELVAGQALRRLGRSGNAVARLSALARRQPRVPAVLWELAQAASEAGDGRVAIAALQSLTRQQPAVSTGWLLLAAELRKAGRGEDAWRADLAGVRASSGDPELLKAAVAMNEGRLDDGEALLRQRLRHLPDDPAGLRLLGEIKWRQGDMTEALTLVARAVALAPGFDLARTFLVRLLLQNNRLTEALEHAELLGTSPSKNPANELLHASVLVRLGDQHGACALYEDLVARHPDHPRTWMNLGHVRKTIGRQAEAVAAYRAAIALTPTLGEAWWSLANLKRVKLDAADVATMTAGLAEATGDEDRLHLHFALGKALEDAGDDALAFAHYVEGNRIRREALPYSADETAARCRDQAAVVDRAFLAARAGGGCAAADPIFVVGLPRSGSTLVEQILASHSMIEGTAELAEMMMIATRLANRETQDDRADYAAALSTLTPDDRLRLGEEYLERTRIHRKTDRPFFIDKMPNNWEHVGLIRLILPNAKIIDARRHPIGCCFSGWKQHFARGQAFTYDLADVGRYYRDYVGLMAAFDAATPGAVHRVIYERMVADTRGEVERLLAYLGLPFEEACLAFWQNDRAVRTASSEQVRTPIFTDAVDHWRRFEGWLDPLVDALGPVVASYPSPPPR